MKDFFKIHAIAWNGVKIYYFLTGFLTGCLVFFVNQRTGLPFLWSLGIVLVAFMAAIINEEIDENKAKLNRPERSAEQDVQDGASHTTQDFP
jgi:hypothetical protein